MTANPGRLSVSPNAFEESTVRMRVAGFGDRSLAAVISRGVFQGRQAEVTHQLDGRVDA
jgi:hypothetical protein